jgi:hypothetical protein
VSPFEARIVAQRLARHSNFSTTQAYIKVADPITREAATRTAQRPALQRFRKQELQTHDEVDVPDVRKGLK